MENQFKKLTAEIKAAFAAALSKKEFAEVVAETKASDNNGTFEVIISTADKDRQGDVVMQDGWELTNYKANPVVLWAHDYYQLPVGVCDSIEVRDGKLVAKGRFAAHAFAQSVRQLYDAGMLKATSVGFIPLETEGNLITKAELLEFSFVPVPANPMALSLAAEKQLNVVEMFVKGIFTKEVEPTEPVTPAVEEQPAAETEPIAAVAENGESDTPAAEVPASDTVEKTEDIEPVTPDEPAPASEPSADDTTTTAPPAEPTDGTNANGGDDETETPAPEVETPAVDGEGASEVEQKGAVKDRLDAQDAQDWATVDAKYRQMDEILEIVYAFCGVYGMPETKPEQFKEMALEVASLITDLANGVEHDGTDMEKGIIAKTVTAGTYKAGRTLSKKTRTLLENTLSNLKDSVAAVDDLLSNADVEGGEGKATAAKADAQNEPTKPQGYEEVMGALKSYSDNQVVLRMVATSVSSALERIKKSAKK